MKEQYCEYYDMWCYEVPEEIIEIVKIDEDRDNDEIYCNAGCDMDCDTCIWMEIKIEK